MAILNDALRERVEALGWKVPKGVEMRLHVVPVGQLSGHRASITVIAEEGTPPDLSFFQEPGFTIMANDASGRANQLYIVQDSPEVIDGVRALIDAMAGELRKIVARGSDTAQFDLVRETAGVSGHLNALQLHGLLSIEKYGELMAEKEASARNVGA